MSWEMDSESAPTANLYLGLSAWIVLAAVTAADPLKLPAQSFSTDHATPLVTETWSGDRRFVPLFDGHSLEGWSGAPGLWSVEDGAITGRTTDTDPIDANTFLIWQGGELGDFELRLRFRIENGNSGVQYRSRDLGDHHVGGYQADIDAAFQYAGILYEEQGRGILARRGERVRVGIDGSLEAVGRTADEADILAAMKDRDWHDYTIIAQGNRLIHQLNGLTTVDVVDEQTEAARARGILALQLHAGPPMKVQFKDLYLFRTGVDASESGLSGCGCSTCSTSCPPPHRFRSMWRLRRGRVGCGCGID